MTGPSSFQQDGRPRLGLVVFLLALTFGYLDFRTQGGVYHDQDLSIAHHVNGMDFDYAYSRAMDLKTLVRAYVRDPFGEHPPLTSRSIYPPAYMAAFMPLTNILPEPAYRLFCAMLVCCLFYSLRAALLSGPHSSGASLIAVVAAAFLFHSYPVSFAIERGNSDLVATAFAAAALLAMTRGSVVVAAACLAGAIHVKLYPAILGLLMVVRHRMRGALWLAVFTTALFFVLGWSGFQSFVSMLMHTANDPFLWPGNHSLYAFLHEIASTSASRSWLPGVYTMSRLALLAVMAAVALAYAGAVWRPSATGPTRVRGAFTGMEVGVIGACFCMMSLLPTVSHDYQLVVQVVPLALLLSYDRHDLCPSPRLAALVTVVLALAHAYLFMPRFAPLPLRLAGIVEPWTMMKTPALLAAFLAYSWLALAGRRHA